MFSSGIEKIYEYLIVCIHCNLINSLTFFIFSVLSQKFCRNIAVKSPKSYGTIVVKSANNYGTTVLSPYVLAGRDWRVTRIVNSDLIPSVRFSLLSGRRGERDGTLACATGVRNGRKQLR